MTKPERADKPSANKSEDDECEHQFEPFKPGFCICVKCYQVHAVERDEARAARASKAAPIAVADLASDISADRHFIAGVKLGWNFRDANDEKGFQACIEGRSAQIREAKAAPIAPIASIEEGEPVTWTEQPDFELAINKLRELLAAQTRS